MGHEKRYYSEKIHYVQKHVTRETMPCNIFCDTVSNLAYLTHYHLIFSDMPNYLLDDKFNILVLRDEKNTLY